MTTEVTSYVSIALKEKNEASYPPLQPSPTKNNYFSSPLINLQVYPSIQQQIFCLLRTLCFIIVYGGIRDRTNSVD